MPRNIPIAPKMTIQSRLDKVPNRHIIHISTVTTYDHHSNTKSKNPTNPKPNTKNSPNSNPYFPHPPFCKTNPVRSTPPSTGIPPPNKNPPFCKTNPSQCCRRPRRQEGRSIPKTDFAKQTHPGNPDRLLGPFPLPSLPPQKPYLQNEPNSQPAYLRQVTDFAKQTHLQPTAFLLSYNQRPHYPCPVISLFTVFPLEFKTLLSRKIGC